MIKFIVIWTILTTSPAPCDIGPVCNDYGICDNTITYAVMCYSDSTETKERQFDTYEDAARFVSNAASDMCGVKFGVLGSCIDDIKIEHRLIDDGTIDDVYYIFDGSGTDITLDLELNDDPSTVTLELMGGAQ